VQILSPEQTTNFATAILCSATLGQSKLEGLLSAFVEKVIPAVSVTPINPPSGPSIASHLFEGGAKSVIPDNGLRPAVEFLKPKALAETKAPIAVAYIGEEHSHGLDNLRGRLLWSTFNTQTKGERLVVVERGMNVPKYYSGAIRGSQQPVISEEGMYPESMQYHLMATEVGRSVQVGAYLALCLAGGHQDKKSRLLILFGENHMKDILVATEYIIKNSDSISWVQKRARAYFTMTSQAG
jgi:hypothetical protein